MSEETKQIAVGSKKDLRSMVESMKGQFKMALPSLLTPDRFMRVALTCINKNPKLLECTQSSVLACLLDCAALGIEPDGRRAHLIPYGKVCTLIIDYKGIAELVRRSGDVATLHAGIVYPDDEFDYAFGTNQFLKHKPSLKERKDAKPVCVYSYVKLKDGQEDFDVMSIEAVDKVRKRSRSGNNGPWVTDYDEMAKKTVFRRHSKWLPLSPELRDKIEKDDEPLTEQERFTAAKPVFGAAVPELPDAEEPPASEPEAEEEKPALATPLEGLRNLLKVQKIEEKAFVKHLISTRRFETTQNLDNVSEVILNATKDDFIAIVEEMKA